MQVLVAPRAAQALAASLIADESLVAAFEAIVATTGELFALGLTRERLLTARLDADPSDSDRAVPDAAFDRGFVARVHLDRNGLEVTLTTGGQVVFIPLPGELAGAVAFCDAAGYPVVAPADAIDADLGAVAQAADHLAAAAPDAPDAPGATSAPPPPGPAAGSSAPHESADDDYFLRVTRIRTPEQGTATPSAGPDAASGPAASGQDAPTRTGNTSGTHAADDAMRGPDGDATTPAAAIPDATHCTRCGDAASRRAVFCRNCGATIE